jgi:predicted DCC family thiol-disulfide oxidoreductase YuxK
MLYDGNCNFCKFWIARWQEATAGQVDYLPSQDARVAQQFTELPRERLDAAVQLIETDGSVFAGADAVFRALAHRPRFRWPLWFYQNVPGVAPVTEAAYGFIAARREFFSFLTRLFWGRDPARPGYSLVRWVFLRGLGLIYLCAFLSLGTQILGLVGHNGILPAAQWTQYVRTQLDQMNVGAARYFEVPTLCWWSASDGFLRFLCGAGVALSLLVVFDVAPALCLFLLWLIYLSLATVCQEFLGFQWDNLLLETGLLAVFFAPLHLLPRFRNAAPPSRVVLWLFRWLLFRLMFESGVVKLASHDPAWSGLRALNFHYETQPLPTWIGWYAHQLPASVQTGCVAIMFVIELAVPFLIFAPRRPRFVGFVLLVLLQVLIFLTGNYCFFNLLTIALCLLLLDDALLLKFIPAKWRPEIAEAEKPTLPSDSAPKNRPHCGWPLWLTIPVALVIIFVSVPQVIYQVGLLRSPPPGFETVSRWLDPFRSINPYGLFSVMTTSRMEIVIEGSNDGQSWLPYEFKYKPGDLTRRPRFVAPHQPRLDWQMWFAALGTAQQNPWLVNFCIRLLQGSPEVLGLLEHNPFPGAPPRYIRAELYEYHFTNFKERRADGAWWRRELRGEYLPAISLRNADEH